MNTSSNAPLHGIRVLDFSAMVAGPYCARLMADAGAEVIKIEPMEGEFMRDRLPVRNGHSLYFAILNAGKKSICADLKSAQGIAIIKELVAVADVVVENFRPGVMRRLGLGHEVLTAINPNLVYCAISGYGQTGSQSQSPAYAPIVHAASGYDMANLACQNGIDRPLGSGIFVADYLTGVHAFSAINMALLRRARTGEGDVIDCALADAMVGILAYEVAAAQEPVTRPRPIYQPTKAKDGFVILAPISPANFEAMARTAGHEEWMTDPRFADSHVRAGNWNALMAELDLWAADKTVDECVAVMARGGVPCSRYSSVADVMASKFAEERGLFEVSDGPAGPCRTPNSPYQMRGVKGGARVPDTGEHSASVLAQLLNRTPAQIEALFAARVLR